MPPPFRSSRRGLRLVAIVAVVLVAAVAATVLAVVLSIRSQLREGLEERDRDRARAEQVVQERARRYATAVTRAHPDVSDQHLDELAAGLYVTVRVIGREPSRPGDLQLVIQVIEPYGGGFTTGDVRICYHIGLTGLGTPGAEHRLTELPNCPIASRRPIEDTSGG